MPSRSADSCAAAALGIVFGKLSVAGDSPPGLPLPRPPTPARGSFEEPSTLAESWCCIQPAGEIVVTSNFPWPHCFQNAAGHPLTVKATSALLTSRRVMLTTASVSCTNALAPGKRFVGSSRKELNSTRSTTSASHSSPSRISSVWGSIRSSMIHKCPPP